MIRSLYSGVSGMKNHQVRMDVVGNNIANVNTTGFKSGRVNFQDSLSQFTGNNPVLGQNQIGTGVRVGSVSNNFTQGAPQSTGRPLDLAIQGEGFFKVTDGTNTFYTREGVFFIGDNGEIVNSQGFRLCDDAGAALSLTMPTSPKYLASIDIGSDGIISAKDDSGATVVVSGTKQIGLTIFNNPGGLKKAGGNLYTADVAITGAANTIKPGTNSTIQSGYLEMSNVDLTEEMTNMITTQRGYQANARTITVSDTLLEELINLKR